MRRLGLAIVLAAAAACDADANFTTRVASDFVPARHVVSVFGVYRDGRMSPDGWAALGPRIVPALGTTPCDDGYGAVAAIDPELAGAIDDYAQADGPTDELVAQLAPAALGDLVLVVTFAGKLPRRIVVDASAPRSPPPAAMGGRGGGRGGMRGGAGGAPRAEPARDSNALDVSASLFSVSQGKSVALVGMEYSGSSVDDALAKFAAKLAQALPSVTCGGWNWRGTVDAAKIRGLDH